MKNVWHITLDSQITLSLHLCSGMFESWKMAIASVHSQPHFVFAVSQTESNITSFGGNILQTQ